MAQLDSGTVLGRFRIDSVIGEGATGTVYLATDLGRGEPVALKLLSPELAQDERFRRRFLRETELAASLDHPSVVRTIAAGDEAGTLYLAMAYVEGSDLRELLHREGRLDPERAVNLIEQVAEALDAAHRAGLVHRDVKPGNLLLTQGEEGERAYVCDFGLARHVSSVSSLTGDRGFVGTIDYVPPEQIEGGKIDARADVYSLGCVLYECLAGSRPFERESELAVVFAHLNEPPPRISDPRPELAQEFDGVFATALAKSPDDRYSTCGELAASARAALQGRTVARRRPKRRRYAAVTVAVAAAAVLGVVFGVETGAGHRIGTPKITERAIDGLTLGHTRSYYARHLGGYKPSTLGGVHFPAMSFEQPEVAVYFPPKGGPAQIMTTWNRDFRTAKGIGPCSTLAAMRHAYGKRVHTNWSGTSPDGTKHFSWQLGRNVLFETQDQRTISSVALFKGVRVEKHGGSPRDYANFVGQNETACK